jgi:hypothetical protein
MTPCLILVVPLAIACVGTAAGQQAAPRQDPVSIAAEVDRLLRSDDARDVAWGAFTAGQYHVVPAVPLLTSALGRSLGANRVEREATELSLLDALIQLDARVPITVLQPFVARWPVPTSALFLNATGDRNSVLLPLVSSTDGSFWHAVANLLLAERAPGFAARLLTGLRLTLVVHVTNNANLGFAGGEGFSSEHALDGALAAGFPPLADYRYSSARPGATVQSVGPITVYYGRRLQTQPAFSRFTYSSPAGPRHGDRVAYLNALIGEGRALEERTQATVVWRGAAALRRAVADHRERVEDRYKIAIGSLVVRGLLSEADSRSLVPDIIVRVEDHRADKSQPLPAMP